MSLYLTSLSNLFEGVTLALMLVRTLQYTVILPALIRLMLVEECFKAVLEGVMLSTFSTKAYCDNAECLWV
jgi:hypothetical protein